MLFFDCQYEDDLFFNIIANDRVFSYSIWAKQFVLTNQVLDMVWKI